MRSKSPLALMELLIMILVFALAAALCLQVFVFSDLSSEKNAAVDRAVTQCQLAAETLKALEGDWEQAADALGAQAGGETLEILYDEDWQVCHTGGAYVLSAQSLPSELETLGKAELVASTAAGEELFRLSVAWQEVDGHE